MTSGAWCIAVPMPCPPKPSRWERDSPAVSVDETLKQMQDLGVEVQIEEK